MLLQTKKNKIQEALDSIKVIPGEPWKITPEIYKPFKLALSRDLEDNKQRMKIIEIKLITKKPGYIESSKLKKELSVLDRDKIEIERELRQLQKDFESKKARPATKEDQELMDRIIRLMSRPQKLK